MSNSYQPHMANDDTLVPIRIDPKMEEIISFHIPPGIEKDLLILYIKGLLTAPIDLRRLLEEYKERVETLEEDKNLLEDDIIQLKEYHKDDLAYTRGAVESRFLEEHYDLKRAIRPSLHFLEEFLCNLKDDPSFLTSETLEKAIENFNFIEEKISGLSLSYEKHYSKN